MSDELKHKIVEFVALAKSCPENFQEICFELLLTNHLQEHNQLNPSVVDANKMHNPVTAETKKEGETKKSSQQEDIEETAIHVKARQFLKKYGLTIGQINQLFYKEEDKFLPLYDDLKTTKASESQIRIALLSALLEGMRSGNFEFDGEEVRGEVQVRKCYDGPNFATNFKNSKELFEGFSKYDKTASTIKLSTGGKEKLAEVIKDMQ